MAVPVGGASGPGRADGLVLSAPAVSDSAGPAAQSDDRVNILLVDDQPANLMALEAMLQGLGQNLVKAESGREALKWLLTHDFAVILLDVKMPDMDGFETAALIRDRDKSRDTPIIFLTAADKTHTEAVRGYAVGAVDYLVKPVVPEFVRSKVSVFVELAKKSELLRRQADQISHAGPTCVPSHGWRVLMAVSGGTRQHDHRRPGSCLTALRTRGGRGRGLRLRRRL